MLVAGGPTGLKPSRSQIPSYQYETGGQRFSRLRPRPKGPWKTQVNLYLYIYINTPFHNLVSTIQTYREVTNSERQAFVSSAPRGFNVHSRDGLIIAQKPSVAQTQVSNPLQAEAVSVVSEYKHSCRNCKSNKPRNAQSPESPGARKLTILQRLQLDMYTSRIAQDVVRSLQNKNIESNKKTEKRLGCDVLTD